MFELVWALLASQPAWAQAEVVDIPDTPVFLGQPPIPEVAATIGIQVEAGGYLRTERPGKAQVRLPDGLVFRLGGDAVLAVEADAVRLDSGQLIAWVEPTDPASVRQIQLPTATAAIRGTTVFIEIQSEGYLIFSWEGDVEVTFQATGETTLLTTGEQIYIPLTAERLPEAEPMSRPEVLQRFETSELIHGFTAPMDTLETIRQELIESP